jgi:hypothetical protein
VFEFDRALGSVDMSSKKAIMLGLIVGLAGRFVSEHQEIIGDYEIELSLAPISPLVGLL